VAPPPVIPEPNISARGTTALDAMPVVAASPARAASPPRTEASDLASAPPLTSATMSSTPPAPAEPAPSMMTEGFTTPAGSKLGPPVTSAPDQKPPAQPRGTTGRATSCRPSLARPAPTVSARWDSEGARPVGSRSTSPPRSEMVPALDQQPAAAAPGELDEANKVAAVTTRASSAQAAHDKAPRVLL
jgi:hypothetical protein